MDYCGETKTEPDLEADIWYIEGEEGIQAGMNGRKVELIIKRKEFIKESTPIYMCKGNVLFGYDKGEKSSITWHSKSWYPKFEDGGCIESSQIIIPKKLEKNNIFVWTGEEIIYFVNDSGKIEIINYYKKIK